MQSAHAVVLNEIRINALGGLTGQQYIELMGEPGESLNGLSIVVIGPGLVLNQGVVKKVISLDGHSIPSDSKWFVAAEGSFSLSTSNLQIALSLPLNTALSFLLVRGTAPAEGADLDSNNDGVLNASVPWTELLDSIAFADALNLNKTYGSAVVHPGLLSLEVHAYRDPNGDPTLWLGGGSLLDTILDTPGAANLNALPTNILLSAFNVPENSAVGTVVGTLSAIDIDLLQTHTFSFTTPHGNAAGMFAIVGNQLRVNNASLDYETQTSYQVSVRATDSGNGLLNYDKNFTINVTDVNEGPTAPQVSGRSVLENSPTDTVVANLTALDPDIGDTHLFSLIAPHGTAGGRFKIVGDELRVDNGTLLNYEDAGSHLVTVSALDLGGLSISQSFSIEVLDVNEAPTDIGLTVSSVAENTTTGTTIGLLSALDEDTTDTHTFSFAAPHGDASGRFAIVGNTLRVGNGALLDYEANTSHQITLRATDSGSNTFDKQFTITITNVNEAPTSISVSSTTIPENSANGTVVGTLSAVNPEAGSLTFSFVAPNSDAGGRFTIVGTELRVANGALLDYEAGSSHPITLRATTGGGQTYDQDVTITVSDVNEAPTDITISTLNVDENTTAGTVVATLSGLDPDAGTTLSFAFAGGANGGGAFTIVGNELRVQDASKLDHETSATLAITVRATDNGTGNLTFDKAFTINVNDVNEAPTGIQLSTLWIDENVANGTLLGILTALDPDFNEAFEYAFTGPNHGAGGRFVIVDNKVVVSDGSLLNFELTPSCEITVRAKDTAGHMVTRSFTVSLNNVNDRPEIYLTGDSAQPNYLRTLLVSEAAQDAVPSAATIFDEDQDDLASLSIQLAPRPDGAAESLAITPSAHVAAGAYDPSTGRLLLSGAATVEEYASVIRTLTYRNTAGTPTRVTRTIGLVANDGTENGPMSVVTLALRPNIQVVIDGDPVVDGEQEPGGGGQATLDFGRVALEATPPVREFALSNTGSEQLTLQTPQLPVGFEFVTAWPGSVAPGETKTVRIRMKTNLTRSYNATVAIGSNDPILPTWTLRLKGEVGETRNAVRNWMSFE